MTTTGIAGAGVLPQLEFHASDARGMKFLVPGMVPANEAGEAYSPTNPMPIADGGVADAAITTASVTSAADVVSLATAGYAGGSFQISSIGSGNTVTFEQSNDNTNWIALPVNTGGNAFSSNSSTATVAGIYYFTAYAAYVRARVSTYGSGTVTISACRKRQKPVGDFSGQMAIASGSSLIGSTINAVGYTDTSTALGSSATYTGSSRATTSLTYATKFKAAAFADQSGTLTIEQSLDGGTTWRQRGPSKAIAAGAPDELVVNITGAYGSSNLFRVKFVNGGTAQAAFALSSAFAAD